MMTGGVAVAKSKPYAKFTRYQYPSNIIILGRSKEGRAAVKDVLKKFSAANHCSIKKFRSEMLPFLRIMMKNSKFKKSFSESHGIDKEDAKNLDGI